MSARDLCDVDKSKDRVTNAGFPESPHQKRCCVVARQTPHLSSEGRSEKVIWRAFCRCHGVDHGQGGACCWRMSTTSNGRRLRCDRGNYLMSRAGRLLATVRPGAVFVDLVRSYDGASPSTGRTTWRTKCGGAWRGAAGRRRRRTSLHLRWEMWEMVKGRSDHRPSIGDMVALCVRVFLACVCRSDGRCPCVVASAATLVSGSHCATPSAALGSPKRLCAALSGICEDLSQPTLPRC